MCGALHSIVCQAGSKVKDQIMFTDPLRKSCRWDPLHLACSVQPGPRSDEEEERLTNLKHQQKMSSSNRYQLTSLLIFLRPSMLLLHAFDCLLLSAQRDAWKDVKTKCMVYCTMLHTVPHQEISTMVYCILCRALQPDRDMHKQRS